MSILHHADSGDLAFQPSGQTTDLHDGNVLQINSGRFLPSLRMPCRSLLTQRQGDAYSWQCQPPGSRLHDSQPLEVTKDLKPERTLDLGEGEYEEYFMVEPLDYDEAFSSLLAVENGTVTDSAFSSDNGSQLHKRDILYSALCYQEGTMGYAQTIGQIVPGICTGFTFAVGM